MKTFKPKKASQVVKLQDFWKIVQKNQAQYTPLALLSTTSPDDTQLIKYRNFNQLLSLIIERNAQNF